MTNGFRIARWAWVVAVSATVYLVVGRLDDIWSEARTIGAGPEYFHAVGHYRLSPSQAAALEDIGLSAGWHGAFVTIRLVLVAGTAIAISALLWRRARTWAPLFLSWFLLNGMLLTALSDDDTNDITGPVGLAVLVLFVGGVVSMIGLLLVFPDDRSARWVISVLAALALAPLYAGLTDDDAVGDWMWENGIYVALSFIAVGLILQVARIVKSRDRTARDLLIMTVIALGTLFALGFTADPLSGVEGPRDGLDSLAQRLAFETAFMAVPIVYGLGVLWVLVRRGHWEMDVRLKGSVGYAGLTTIVVLGYFGTVAVVQAVVNDVSGAAGNTFALMVSTAVIAAAILPARAGLQRLIDRLFDRRRRDADRVVARFESDVVRGRRPDEVEGALLDTVEQVFRPEQADIWLAPGGPQ